MCEVTSNVEVLTADEAAQTESSRIERRTMYD